MNVYSKRGVRHYQSGGCGLEDGWTTCGKWTRDMFANWPRTHPEPTDCKRCFRVANHG